MLLPVIDLVSFLIKLSKCLGMCFGDRSIWLMKDINLRIRVFFRCLWSETGSIKFLCVDKGKLKVFLMDTFHVFSNRIASLPKRSHNGEPVKWQLNKKFVVNFVVGWAKENSCKSSQFFLNEIAPFYRHIPSHSIINISKVVSMVYSFLHPWKIVTT